MYEGATERRGGEIPRESRQQILENSFRKTGAEKEKSNGRGLKGKEHARARESGRQSERGGGERRRKEAVEKNEIRDRRIPDEYQ